MAQEHIHFVTGRLAEHSLRRVLGDLAPVVGFDYSVDVLGISVAALMTPQWIAPRISVPSAASRIIVPGYCQGDLAPVRAATGVLVERGPRDLRHLPEYFDQAPLAGPYGGHEIEILAEINHCPRRTLAEILAEADHLSADGADWIDLGCEPGTTWSEVSQTVRALRDRGYRISIDSMNGREIDAAVRAGAELVLSVNHTNRHAAADWGTEVVAIPDQPGALTGLDETVQMLAEAGVPVRIDPILEPIGFGFAASLARFLEVRRNHPDVPMLMGVGNLTELTDVDSCGVNVLLLGFCQELGVRSVLTTQVINWARTSVRECALARQLVYHAVRHRTLPKHVEPRLVMLRDGDPAELRPDELEHLSRAIRDHNLRIFAAGGDLHVLAADLHLRDSDPFRLFDRLLAIRATQRAAGRIDAAHAFYLGYELSKAVTALQLGKRYEQDAALDWGMLTVAEHYHRIK
ncbi:MAG: dihydropteroate synthase [Planctomycetes bacterium RBG_16_64_10]|nr:MAG: dihydropteroate synthase [Planctomycetes bacterium RBG_16_64_10]